MTFGNFKWGDQGKDVETLQQQLSTLGYPVVIDGIFGPETDAAVRAFQSDSGIRVDGIVGPETQAAMASALTADGTAPVTPTTTPDTSTTRPSGTPPPVTVPGAKKAGSASLAPAGIAVALGLAIWYFGFRK